MEQANQLATRLRQVLLDGKWITNLNYKEALEDVSWEEARQQVGNLNTILALTFHINYYMDGLLDVFNGGELTIRDKYSFDYQHINSEKDWINLKNELISNPEAFADAVEKMTPEKLDGPFINPQYGTYRRNIEGVIEHSYYHLGQLAILRKLIRS